MSVLVQLLDCMGGDLTVVNSARVSMGKWTDELRERDIRLINYLAKNGHWTPFSQPQLQFRIKMPIFVARQYWRHTIGFTRNEMSRRYVSFKPEFFLPDYFRPSDENIKQGSKDEEHSHGIYWQNITKQTYKQCKDVYESMIRDGICPEQARMVLPQATYTEFIETGSLYAYARLYNLRSKPDAQKEIRVYVEEIGDIILEKFPYSWKALMYDKNN